MIARRLHDDDFLAFVKLLRQETHMEIYEGKRDRDLVRDTIELWEQMKHVILLQAHFVKECSKLNVTEDYLTRLSQTSPTLESDPSSSSSG